MCLKNRPQKGGTVGDSSFYSRFDFPGLTYVEILKCF